MESIPEYIRRKHDRKLVKYLDPRMKKFLGESYGLIVYQDDLLFCAIELAGYNWEEADKFRKAVGKKIPKEMAAQREKFTAGIIENGQTPEFAEKLWKIFEPFQAYGFNKAHAASYGLPWRCWPFRPLRSPPAASRCTWACFRGLAPRSSTPFYQARWRAWWRWCSPCTGG